MQSSNYPTPIPLPFAENAGAGYKTVVPQASQIGITPGAASYNDGFPPLTMTAKTAGGVPPKGQDINGVLNAITRAVRWAGAGGHYPYNSTFSSDSNVLGYPVGAKVLSTDGTAYWVNQTENNTTDPNAGGAGWYPSESFGFAAITLTSSNVTLTPAQYNKKLIILSGDMTTNLNLIFPAIATTWTVVNNCTGAYSVTCKTISGTGISVLSNGYQTSALIYCDGTNILPVSISPTSLGVVGSARNLKCSITAAASTATFTADELVVKTAIGGLKYQISSLSKTINLATTGAGGMDTGIAPVSGFVAIYAILNPTTGATALLGVNATSLTAPNVYGGANVPAGYNASALLSVWPTNSSSQFVTGYQLDRSIYTSPVQVLITTVQQSSPAVVSITSAVPLNAKTCRGISAIISSSAGAGLASYIYGSPAMVGAAGSEITNITANGGISASFNDIPLITPQNIYYTAAATLGATMTYTISICGYII